LVVLIIFLYFYLTRHPANFPPHPKWTLPLIGNALSIGNDTNKGFSKLHQKLGPIFGLWMGPLRGVVVADFDMICEIGAKAELTGRPELGIGNGEYISNGLGQAMCPLQI